MELKWLEDFVDLAETRSFSASAKRRHVTQSAFSRRIQALEAWVGVALIDRSIQPIGLSGAGREFLETAEETIRTLAVSVARIRDETQSSGSKIISVSALHSLSLIFFPKWIGKIEKEVGVLQVRLLSDSFLPCLKALSDGNYDFMLMLYHPHVPIPLDPTEFPHIVVGVEDLVAVGKSGASDALPLLSYPESLFLGRMTAFAQHLHGNRALQLKHISDSAMALKAMALDGQGFAWLPRTLVDGDITSGALVDLAPPIAMEVRLYRNRRRRRPIAQSVWEAAKTSTDWMV